MDPLVSNPQSRAIRCKTEGCTWSVPSFYRRKGDKSTRSGWAAYADHLLNMDGANGHPKLTLKQLERIRRGWEPGRAATSAEEE